MPPLKDKDSRLRQLALEITKDLYSLSPKSLEQSERPLWSRPCPMALEQAAIALTKMQIDMYHMAILSGDKHTAQLLFVTLLHRHQRNWFSREIVEYVKGHDTYVYPEDRLSFRLGL